MKKGATEVEDGKGMRRPKWGGAADVTKTKKGRKETKINWGRKGSTFGEVRGGGAKREKDLEKRELIPWPQGKVTYNSLGGEGSSTIGKLMFRRKQNKGNYTIAWFEVFRTPGGGLRLATKGSESPEELKGRETGLKKGHRITRASVVTREDRDGGMTSGYKSSRSNEEKKKKRRGLGRGTEPILGGAGQKNRNIGGVGLPGKKE